MPAYTAGVAAIVKEFAENGTPEDKECLDYVLKKRAGSDATFSNGNLKRDCDKDGVVIDDRLTNEGLLERQRGAAAPAAEYGMTLDDFVSHPSSVTAGLEAAEVLACRVYTTAAYRSLNNPLRNRDAQRPPHPFPVTINFLKSAIGKMRAVEAARGDAGEVDLWRGMKNLRVGAAWAKTGGTELAPMSTTTDLKVAVEYSMSESSLLFKIKTKSFMQRGADLEYLSAFPAEKELLYPPLTFLQPTGWSMEHSVGGVKFTVIEVEPFAG